MGYRSAELRGASSRRAFLAASGPEARKMLQCLVAGALLLSGVPATAQDAPTEDANRVERVRAAIALNDEAKAVAPALNLLPSKASSGDINRSLKMLRKLSDDGNMLATVLLASILGDGWVGVPPDLVESNRLLLRVASATGDHAALRPLAAGFLGLDYKFGLGVTKDREVAIKWFRIAAEGGDPTGMANLGLAYVNGDHVPMDMAQAVRWLKPAADKGERSAMAMMAALYEKGEGVAKDPARALELFQAAGEKGSVFAASEAAQILLRGDSASQAKGLHFARIAAEKNDAKAMGLLGELYRTGIGTPKDLAEAASWSRKSAQAGEPIAMMTMVHIFADSRGSVVTQQEALQWLEAAAAANQKQALDMLGGLYERGLPPYARDVDKAISYYRRAAALGYVHSKDALSRLGVAAVDTKAPDRLRATGRTGIIGSFPAPPQRLRSHAYSPGGRA
jgi:TPR repeat protein